FLGAGAQHHHVGAALGSAVGGARDGGWEAGVVEGHGWADRLVRASPPPLWGRDREGVSQNIRVVVPPTHPYPLPMSWRSHAPHERGRGITNCGGLGRRRGRG